MEPTRGDIRSAILDAMCSQGPRGERPNQYNRLMTEVVALLHDRGFTDGVEYSDPMGGGLTGRAESRFREQVWDLIAAGILVPGYNEHNDKWPHLSVTEPGEVLLKEGRPTPADPEGFVARVDELLPHEERRILLYLREAVGSFNRQLYLASTVMLGVAAEGLVLRLAEAIAGAFPDREEGAQWHEENIESQYVAVRRFRAVRDEIQRLRDDLPYELKERFNSHWRSINNLLRLERNEAGHPSGVERSRDEAHASLLLFPVLAELTSDLEAWLAMRGSE